ncbi:MAG: hypothetical protein RLZZ200_1778 [Pseudomonadota bacterium]|jgi:hypothetical protein
MSFKLRYDAKADRLRMVVQADGKATRVFWLQRNQALAALAALSRVARKLGVKPDAVTPVKAPPVRPKHDPAVDDIPPESLDGMRVRQADDVTQLLLVQGEKALSFGFKAEGLKLLLDRLAMQCERAGWDPVAGLKRLQAMAQVRAAITKAKKRS